MAERRITGPVNDPGRIASGKLQTEIVTTSGETHDFTGIASWVKKITVMFAGVSTNGTSVLMIQLGDSGGFETSGYNGSFVDITTVVSNGLNSSGFQIANSNAAAAVWHGTMVLTLEDSANNVWAASGVLAKSDTAFIGVSAGTKALSGTLTQVRLTTVNGTDVFDAGAVNILLE